jgi:TonB family protein
VATDATGAKDKLSPYLAASVGLHVGLFVVVALVPALLPASTTPSWGSSTATGMKVGLVSSLPGIDLPSPPVVQEDAKPNRSETLNPPEPAPKPEVKKATKADVQIPSRGAKPTPKKEPPSGPARTAASPPPPAVAPNAIPGAGGQIALPYGQAAGSGGQATFGDANFGVQYGWYVTNMTRAIEEKWRDSISANRGTSPRVYLTFTLNRAGKPSNLQVEESSGSAALDASAQRAVLSASIPPLPAAYTGSTVDVRFYFEYKR